MDADDTLRRHARGEMLVREGGVLDEWIAIESGVVSLCAGVAGTRVAVATLWRGDAVGWASPQGRGVARFDVRAMSDVTARHLPPERAEALLPDFAATELRLQEQVFMRLAGNGLQRLLNVLATLATALMASTVTPRMATSLALPLGQACLGELSGLSRRQTWIYLGQLAEAGWARTERTRILLEGVHAWLALPGEVASEGLGCIATLADCLATLERLSREGGPLAAYTSRSILRLRQNSW